MKNINTKRKLLFTFNLFIFSIFFIAAKTYSGVVEGVSATVTLTFIKVTLNSPNGGENWQVGSSQSITWTSVNVENVRIDYTTNNGTDWLTIAESTPAGTGIYEWVIPNTPSNQFKIKISSIETPSVYDDSDEVFTMGGGGSTQISILKEGFDGSFPPAGWTKTVTNTNYTWNQGNPVNNNFNTIDPSSLNSAICPWVNQNQNEWLISPAFSLGDGDAYVEFYAGYSTQWLTSATIKMHISTNSGANWTELWSAENDGQPWGWRMKTVNLTTYKNKTGLQLAWQYVGNDGDLVGLDGIEVMGFQYTTDITVNSPNGGENWQVGSSQSITWTSTGVTNVRIEYTTNNGDNWISVTNSTASTGSFIWITPNTPSTQCRVRISNTANTAINDISDNVFTISQQSPPIKVTSPNGGENWQVSSNQNITWTSSNVENVRIEYTTNNGSNWIEIASSTPAATSSYSWVIPNTPSNECKVKMTSVSNPDISDESDESFTISTEISPSLTLTSPNGGEYWVIGELKEITWNSVNIESIKIEYTTNNGIVWSIITNSTPAVTGSYLWTIPNTPSTECKVKISDVNNLSTTNQSDTTFTIAEPPQILLSITSPNGFESWKIGDQKEITWNSQNIESIKIEYTTNNGSDWIDITTSTPAITGSYSWTIPNTPSTECKVKISDVSNTSTSDESDNLFTIYKPEIYLSAPNGGELWKAGSIQIISWSSSYIDNIKIEVSFNNGVDWVEIINSISAGEGLYQWTLPDIHSTQSRVKISDVSDVTINDISNNSFTIYKPSINIIAPDDGAKWQVGTNQNISWESSYVNEIKIELSPDNGNSWLEIVPSIEANSGSYQWNVSDYPSTQCIIRVSDITDANIFSTSSGNFIIFVYTPSIVNTTTISFGDITSPASYRMFSLPGQNSKLITELLTGTHKTDWNVYFDNGQAANWRREYDGSSIFRLTPGKGFWVLSSNPITVNTTVDAVPLQLDASFSIQLHSGWNIIGNPFDKNVQWEAVRNKNSLQTNQMLYYWNGDQYQNAAIFEPYKGYYFNNSQNLANLSIPYPVITPLGKIATEDVIKYPSDKIDITLTNKVYRGIVTVGFDVNAEKGFDEMDYYYAPYGGALTSIAIINNTFPERLQNLFVEARPFAEDGSDFTLEIINKNETNAKLVFDISEKLNDNLVYLVDEQYYEMIDLRKNNEKRVPPFTEKKYYKLIIGNEAYIAKLKSELVPSDYILFQNYPNPFNPVTKIKYALPADALITIKVYDILGQDVITLVNEWHTAGGYEIEFNSIGLPSGIYFYKMQSGNFNDVKKMTIVK